MRPKGSKKISRNREAIARVLAGIDQTSRAALENPALLELKKRILEIFPPWGLEAYRSLALILTHGEKWVTSPGAL